MDALWGRWSTDCAAALPGAEMVLVDEVGHDLAARWRESHRRYHDPTHLAEVLSAVDTLCAVGDVAARDRAAALLAAWFHDAVYGTGSAEENEEASAALAGRSLTRLGASPELVERVRTLVLDTVSHDVDDEGDDARTVLHDADLWVLSAPVARFDEYCAQVRAEYAHVPPAEYGRARSAVLRPFLVRPHVYLTTHARTAWEPGARENLARELTRLAG